MKIIFATANRGKLREASEILGERFTLLTPHDLGIDEDIQVPQMRAMTLVR